MSAIVGNAKAVVAMEATVGLGVVAAAAADRADSKAVVVRAVNSAAAAKDVAVVSAALEVAQVVPAAAVDAAKPTLRLRDWR